MVKIFKPGGWVVLGMALWVALQGCSVFKKAIETGKPASTGVEEIQAACIENDTVKSVLITGSEAVMEFMDERYEVSLSLYSVKDSIIYLSAVSSGYEIVRALMDRDSIKVIDRINRIVYRTPLHRQFGYQYPVQFQDIQHLISKYYLCDILDSGIAREERIVFELDEEEVKKRIWWGNREMELELFEFYHRVTGQYLMGEKTEEGLRVYFNFMVNPFELTAWKGETAYNREVEVKMNVNSRRYTFTDLR